MATDVSIRVDLRDVDAFGAKLSSLGLALTRDAGRTRQALNRAAEELVGRVREAILSSPTNSRFANVRTGALARSYKAEHTVTGSGFTIAAVSDSVYARIQDEGGEITPRTVKSLAIPLTRWASNQWPRDVRRGVLFRRGNALSRRIGKRKVVNEYALAKRVRIRAKRYTRTGLQDALPMIYTILFEQLIMGEISGP